MISENYYTAEPAKAWSFYRIPDLSKTEADSMMLEEVVFTLDPLARPVANVEKAVKRGDMSGV